MAKTNSIDSDSGYIVAEDGSLIPDYDQTIKNFSDGDVISGVIVKIDKDEVLVDVGYKSEGVIPLNELAVSKNIKPEEIVCLGEEIDAMVLQKEDKDGRLILSKKRADQEKIWRQLEKSNNEKSLVCGKVVEVVRGGLIVDIGLRGFLPASLIDVKRVKDLSHYLGQEMQCKVIEMDRQRNNVVLSRKAVLDETRRSQREKALSKIKKGSIITGRVSSIVDFGAFVNIGGLDGLIHISEISWDHIDHPSQVLTVNQEVKVKVLDVDYQRGRISLGLKQCQENPWKKKVAHIEKGQILEGKVNKVSNYGTFIDLGQGIEGFIHASELSDNPEADPKELLKEEQTVTVKVLDKDFERRRLNLSLKDCQPKSKSKVTAEVKVEEQAKLEEENNITEEAKKATSAQELKSTKTKMAPVKTEKKEEEEETASIILSSGSEAFAAEEPVMAASHNSLEEVLNEMKQARQAKTE